MNLQYDKKLDIATAATRVAKTWANKSVSWSQLVDRCRDTQRTHETVAEYRRMSKEEQSRIKDNGGFVGGYLSNGSRKNGNVQYRSIATLDIDYGTPDVWDDFTMQYNNAAFLYTTHKSTPENPRYRLVIPFSRDVQPKEYEPICRKIASSIGIDLFDSTTYQLPRLFYWPSTSKDGAYDFQFQDGPFLDPDTILNTYKDWTDASSWPIGSKETEILVHEMRRLGEPTEKPGLIGLFCRAYTIEDAIEKFLSDFYVPTAIDGRYTYKEGSVAGGLVCYDSKFAYSHHETDPNHGKLLNAYDIVRLSLFGHLDEGKNCELNKLPSTKEMEKFVQKDEVIKSQMFSEMYKNAVSDFKNVEESDANGSDDSKKKMETDDEDWTSKLETTKNGGFKSTIDNIYLILENEKELKGHLWLNEMSSDIVVEGGLPWRQDATRFGNRDLACLRWYLEKYGITGEKKIQDALDILLTNHRRNPVLDYLNSLSWDGKERLDKLVIDYVGAEDNELNRAMTRKHFTAAVKRAYEPGCKYDYCLILSGPEGIGKSTLFSIMGGEWFNDSVSSIEGKDGCDNARDGWIFELAELSSIKKSDVESVKNFISRQRDRYRPAYARVAEDFPRHCVFSGTTNEEFFLKGCTGNRRFWVIAVNPELRKYENTRDMLLIDRDQLWAEAVYRYQQKEPLFLSKELEDESRLIQEKFNDDSDDPMMEDIINFLDTKIPATWDTMSQLQRKAFYRNLGEDDPTNPPVDTRKKVCIAEYLIEWCNLDKTSLDYKYKSRKVGTFLNKLTNWDGPKTGRFRYYGRQRTWFRSDDDDIEDDEL